MITTYTTYDDVRAALGISVDDIDDATLALNLYSDMLDTEFDDVDSTLASTYTTVKAQPIKTENEQRFLRVASLFATYCVAKQLTDTVPLFVAKQETDSKAAGTRFDTGYKDTIAAVLKSYGRFKVQVASAFSALSAGETVQTKINPFSISSPSYDPITG